MRGNWRWRSFLWAVVFLLLAAAALLATTALARLQAEQAVVAETVPLLVRPGLAITLYVAGGMVLLTALAALPQDPAPLYRGLFTALRLGAAVGIVVVLVLFAAYLQQLTGSAEEQLRAALQQLLSLLRPGAG